MPRDSNGNVDFAQAAQDLFIRDNYQKMVKILQTQTRNSLKEETIREIGNQTVGKPSDRRAHQPEGIDPLDQFMESAKERASSGSLSTFYEQINNNK